MTLYVARMRVYIFFAVYSAFCEQTKQKHVQSPTSSKFVNFFFGLWADSVRWLLCHAIGKDVNNGCVWLQSGIFPHFPMHFFFTLSHTPTVIRSTMVAENRKRNHIIHKYTHTAHFTINENIRVYYYLHFTFFFFLQKTDGRIAVCQQSYFGFN